MTAGDNEEENEAEGEKDDYVTVGDNVYYKNNL